MRPPIPILLAAVSLGFAPAPFLTPRAGTADADLKALEGEWCCCALDVEGEPGHVTPGATFVYKGNRLTVACAPLTVTMAEATDQRTVQHGRVEHGMDAGLGRRRVGDALSRQAQRRAEEHPEQRHEHQRTGGDPSPGERRGRALGVAAALDL